MICADCARAADAKLLTGHCGSENEPSSPCMCQHRAPGTGQVGALAEGLSSNPFPLLLELGAPMSTAG